MDGCPLDDLPGALQASRPYERLPSCSPASSTPLPLSPERFKSGIHSPSSHQQKGDDFAGGTPRSILDGLFGASPVREEDVEHSPRRLRPQGVDGRVEHRLGSVFPRTDASWALDVDKCRCPSPYKCEGVGCIGGVPLGLPSPRTDASCSGGRTTPQPCPTFAEKGAQYLSLF